MGLIEDQLSSLLIAEVPKGRKNTTRPLRVGRLAEPVSQRCSRGSPEVLVKISGFTQGSAHLKAHMSYISRHGKVDIEDQYGSVFGGKAEVDTLWESWDQEISQGNREKSNRRDTVKIILSMPPGTDPEALREAVRSFAASEFSDHAYLFSMHTDEKHPHVHLTVQMRGFSGERLNPRKADLQRWREGFAECLLDQGIDCVATPRAEGNRAKGKKQSRCHAEARRERERGPERDPPRSERRQEKEADYER